MSSDLFKMLPTNNLFTNHMYIWRESCVYKEDLALNNLQGLICHKTQLIQISHNNFPYVT